MPKLNKQKTEKAYLSVFNFMHKGTFNLVDGVASHKNMKKSGSDVGYFIYHIIFFWAQIRYVNSINIKIEPLVAHWISWHNTWSI